MRHTNPRLRRFALPNNNNDIRTTTQHGPSQDFGLNMFTMRVISGMIVKPSLNRDTYGPISIRTSIAEPIDTIGEPRPTLTIIWHA